jgi:hypothetical protein
LGRGTESATATGAAQFDVHIRLHYVRVLDSGTPPMSSKCSAEKHAGQVDAYLNRTGLAPCSIQQREFFITRRLVSG